MTVFTQRPLTDADASAFVALTEAMYAADDGGHHENEAGYRFTLNHPLSSPGFDGLQGVFDGDRLVAMAWVVRAEQADPAHWMRGDGGVHPDYRGRGIGTRLVRWQTDLARRIHEHYFAGRPLEFATRVPGANAGARELFANEGFTAIRWSFEMTRPADAPEPAEELPADLELEVYHPDVNEDLLAAHNEIFRDHWRANPMAAEGWKAWISQEKIRRDLSFLLRDPKDGTIASFVICSSTSGEGSGPERDLHLNIVGSRREYRGRGLASALIAHVVRQSRKAGFGTQSLNVDADSPTGAVGVYRRAGFAVAREYVCYNRELEL